MTENNVYKNTLKLVIFIGFFQNSTLGSIKQHLFSPCPEIFQYHFDENSMLYGTMKIEYPQGRKIQLNIELSVGNNVEGYNGNIQLAYDKEKVVNDIMHRRPIFYKVFFPVWKAIPPKITKIFLNGDLICSGPKISIGMVPVLTTINLQHTLSIDVTPLHSSFNPPMENLPETPTNFDVRKFDKQFPDNEVDKTPDENNRPPPVFGNNQFNFNPPPPKNGMVHVHNINFNPQMPKDPTKIYPGNPFFINNLASTSPPNFPNFEISDDLDGNKPITTSAVFNTRTSERPPDVPKRTPIIDTPSVNFPIDVTKSDTGFNQRPYGAVCGRSGSTNSLVINGNSVPRGAYPWLVAIFRYTNTGPVYQCSGSLISNKHVVTAAHCVKTETKKLRPQELLCVLGKLNIQKWVPMDGEKMIEPETINVHPDYITTSSDADIAVLTLGEDLEFTKIIRPLCLWNGPEDLNPVIGMEGTVVGWGKDENGVLMTVEPKQTSLPIVSQERCLRSNFNFQYITSNRTFCAGFRNGSGPCNGDSGSGFLMKKDGRWMLKGIVSMSISEAHLRTCDLTNYVVFTDASKYLDWLLSFIK